MDSTGALGRFEAAVADQLAISGDEAVETAGRALLAALRPAGRELAMELAEQAAAEVGAQLPDHDISVVLESGEPVLRVREQAAEAGPPADEDYEARLTLRLPPSLKGLVEDAAGSAGDSINSWVVDALSGAARKSRRGAGRRVQGRVRT